MQNEVLSKFQITLQIISTVAMVVATVAMAVFTGLVWRLNRRQHQMAYEASLRVVEELAQFHQQTKGIRVELVLNNSSLVPALISEWSVIVRDGHFQESIADGNLEQTRLVNVQRFVGGKWWVIDRGRPTAFSLAAALPKEISSQATVNVEIRYFGGRRPVSTVRASIPVEVVA
jgi:hypothetical protein